MLFADFPDRLVRTKDERRGGEAYRMEGGVPAGTRIRPGELGCLITRMRINMTTRLGKRSKKLSGIDMEEFPFNRIRLRKKDNFDWERGFSCFQSSVAGSEGMAGKRFSRR